MVEYLTSTFRPLNKIEAEILNTSSSNIIDDIVSTISNLGYKIYFSLSPLRTEKNSPRVYLVPHDLVAKVEDFRKKSEIISSGIYFGFINKGKFFMSLEGMEFLYQRQLFGHLNKIIVTENGEKSILYGNPIKKGMILELQYSKMKTKIALVLNENDELLAMARLKKDHASFMVANKDEIVALNLIDKGYYIRREK